MSTKLCPKCQHDNPEGAKFCNECAHPLQASEQTPSIDFNKPHSYTPKFLADKILTTRSAMEGERKRVTVLFADLRKFTQLAESTPPKEVVKILNGYFKEMEEAIHQNYGLVLQYVGDEIEAVFGAPVYRKDHPKIAVHAALEMRERLRKVNKDLRSQGYAPLAHGVGVHTGKVVAANIGSPHRLSYALVGDTVNLASRLQELTKTFDTEILISGSTRKYLNNGFSLKRLTSTTVRGKNHPVEIFSLICTRLDLNEKKTID